MATRTKKKEETDTFTAESIREQIVKLEDEKAAFLEQANRQLAMLDGAIQGLRNLLANGQGPDGQ